MSERFFPLWQRRRRGFTLIELLVVIAIIAVLIALLLPAVQSAREAARRMQCTNNLKQLGLAALNYESTNGCYPPMGTSVNLITAGWLVRMLPFYEQAPLYNAYNNSQSALDASNITLAGVSITALLCPSDPAMANKFSLSDAYGTSTVGYAGWRYIVPPGTWYQSLTNYAACPGPFSPLPGALGMINYGTTTIAGVTDGTSNSMMFTENAIGWWYNSSTFSVMDLNQLWNRPEVAADAKFAPNPWRYMNVNASGMAGLAADIFNSQAASSMHPGGLNCAFGDGSVKFIKETISSWQNLPPLFSPPASYYTSTVTVNLPIETVNITFTSAAQLGVWQMLNTRAGGEVVSSDSY